MKFHLILLAAFSSTALLALAQPTIPLDPPWMLSSETRNRFEAGQETKGFHRDSHAKYVRATSAKAGDWATLMQVFSAADYRGKRLRFQAQVRTEDVTGWTGLWMRVDCEEKRSCAFYNSQDKPMHGTNGWTLRSVTLDVPADAKSISFGVITGSSGTTWIDDLKMEAVGKEVAVDSLPSHEEEVELRTKPSL
ncbi:transcriptional regulator [Pseudoduganella sp. S-14]|jgi:hypothetical protein|uniref:transcriptional regulator n=1 Tax=Pseudoduganella sp. S-14 TaxID=3404065 RepID=UPI003CECEC84